MTNSHHNERSSEKQNKISAEQSTKAESNHNTINPKNHYKKLLWMMVFSFISMFVLMYAMVDKLDNVIPNVNQFYMAGLMASPMLIIELILMGNMYPNKKLNTILMGVGAVALLLFWYGIRKQTAVGDVQFLKSMIPHHAGAILMVEESDLKDPEVVKLSKEIISAQNKEIEFMKAKINELENKNK